MGDQYRLVEVGNAELVAGLSKLVQQGNSLTARVLAHLVELAERQLHLELGFASLFAYCVERLGMSEGAAGRRVTAARVCRRFPEAFERVARGELSLCALCALAPHLSEQNAGELFEASNGKTRRQVEQLLAVRFPRPDVREQIRRLPARAQVLAHAAIIGGVSRLAEQATPARALDALSEPKKNAALVPAAEPGAPDISADHVPGRVEPGGPAARPRPRSRELEPLSADRFGVHFTADAELRELIERARELASHRVPNGDLAGLMKLMVASFVKHEEKRRFGVGTRPRAVGPEVKPASLTPPGGAAVASCTGEAATRTARLTSAGPATRVTGPTPLGLRSRYVRVQVRREIHARDGGQCSYVSADGRRCNARAFTEFDHVEPFAENGSSEAPNLRILCKGHNLLYARKCFGKSYISAKISARKARRLLASTEKVRDSRPGEASTERLK